MHPASGDAPPADCRHMRLRTPILIAVLAFVFLGLPADAGVDQCSFPAVPITKSPPPLPLIQGSFAYQDGSGCNDTSGVVGGGNTYVCPNPYGESCGPMKLAGQTVTCWWATMPGSTVIGLAAGIDQNLDGNVWYGTDGAFTVRLFFDEPSPLPIPNQVYAFSFVAGLSGRVIAYPVSAIPNGSPLDQTRVLCV